MNYFILNKNEDFARGFCHNFVSKDDAITAKKGRNAFFSRVFDACESEKQWHRMKFNIPDCNFKIFIYASDKLPDVLDVTCNENLSIDAKQTLLQGYLVKESYNFNDIFLHGINARYLWFCIELRNNGEENIEISDIYLYFDGDSIVKYLPEIYQKSHEDNDFFKRFLMIFQSYFEDINDEIEKESHIYNPMTTKYLQYLAEFIGLEEIHMWEEEKLRMLIKNIKHLYKIRGTREGLLQLLSLSTGGGTYVYENKNDIASGVNIFIKEKNLKEQNTIRKIAQRAMPVGVFLDITVLKDYVLLGSSTYLGVNTRLVGYDTIGLLGTSRLNYTVLRNRKENLEDK